MTTVHQLQRGEFIFCNVQYVTKQFTSFTFDSVAPFFGRGFVSFWLFFYSEKNTNKKLARPVNSIWQWDQIYLCDKFV